MKRQVLGTSLAILGCNAVGILGALFTSTDSEFYRNLVRPSFQPPGWLFGPVWTLLYTLMGIAVYRVFDRRDEDGARVALWLFLGQLVLNGIWSPIFFGAEAITLACVVIGALWVMLAITIRQFLVVDRIAGLLLVPYILWVSFATVLNATIVTLN